jgi:katanin p60 ATPase-containing subunit A1
MTLDMRDLYKASLDRALKKARRNEAQGDLEAAASAYVQAASLEEQMSRKANNQRLRDQHVRQARAYEQKANRILGGSALGGATDNSAKAPAEANVESGSQIESLIHKSSASWDDIGGLDETKEEIKLAYGLTFAKKPEGVEIEGRRTILFYGPPGTGKTMLAAATSGTLEATFFNVSIGGILSKYFGESSKLIGELFQVARQRSPSVIFLDEFEALTPQRTGDESGSERRILSTILAELDGISSKDSDAYVLTIASTNVPWTLDKAILSRFQKKVLIPLPDQPAREAILRHHLEKKGVDSNVPYVELADLTEGYSGREIAGICQEVINRIILDLNPSVSQLVDQGIEAVKNYTLALRPVERRDFEISISGTRPLTTPEDIEKYADWISQQE